MDSQKTKRRQTDGPQDAAISHGGPGEIAPRIMRVGLTPERPITIFVQHLTGAGETQAAMHLALETGVVLSGHIERDHGEGWFRLGSGQAWACASLETHRWRLDHRGVIELRFAFLPSLFSRMPNLAGFDSTVVFRSPIRSRAIGAKRSFRRSLAKLGRELAEKYRDHVPPGRAYIDLLRFLEILAGEAAESDIVPEEPWSDLAAASRMQPALELVERMPERRVSVAEAARVCCMGRSSFDRLFKRITGLGFAQFALRSRLSHAAHVLRYTDAPMKSLARRFGFTDASHLHRAFVAHYGMTPGRYREAQEHAGSME